MKQKFKIFKRCPKSNKIVGLNKENLKSAKYWLLFPIIGLCALVWFLIRVIPKPSRAAYPCQKIAMPIAASFLSFLAGITGIAAVYKVIKDKKSFKSIRGIAFILTLCFVVYSFIPAAFTGCGETKTDNNYDNYETQEKYSVPANGIGIYPGRVVYAHDPSAVKYEGSGDWWEDRYTVPEKVKKMFTDSLCALTGKDSSAEAWDALFRNFNDDGEPYKKGEKIVIKLNMNQDSGDNSGIHIPSPQLVEALVSELINTAGVSGGDITLTDPSRSIGDHTYSRFAENADLEMQKVRFVAQNRIPAVPDKNEPLYFADGQTGYVSTDYTAAKYLINLAVFRVHFAFGITLCGKNHFGSVKFEGDENFSPINMHASWDNGYGKYSHITDLTAFSHLGGKTLLYMIDGLYTAYHQEDRTVRKMKSFGDTYPSSLFISQDPCAIDSVAYDYLSVEIEQNGELQSVMPAGAPDNYMIEAAYADSPPSNTNYDPDKTGIHKSLGAYEHWNDEINKQYSRNLGKDYGIELVKLEAN